MKTVAVFRQLIRKQQTNGRFFSDGEKRQIIAKAKYAEAEKKAYESEYSRMLTQSAKMKAREEFAKDNQPTLKERAVNYLKGLKNNAGQIRGVSSRRQSGNTGGDKARAALFGARFQESTKSEQKTESAGDRVRRLWGM